MTKSPDAVLAEEIIEMLKKEKIYEVKSGKNPEVILNREQMILEMIKTNGKVTRKEVMDTLNISDSTANRLLAGLETKGTIKREGQMRGTCYVAVGEK